MEAGENPGCSEILICWTHFRRWKNEVLLFHRMAACCQIRISPHKTSPVEQGGNSKQLRQRELLSTERKPFFKIKGTFEFYLLE